MTGFSISMDLIPSNTTEQASQKRLEIFMQDITGRALIMMESATRGQYGIAHDLVQEAFISLYKSYSDKTTEEWYPLFYTILNNKLQDWRRKESRRGFAFFKKSTLSDDEDLEVEIIDEQQINPLDMIEQDATVDEVYHAVQNLPTRQQQAFMLRAWEGFDIQTTAKIMNCSEGSVKTHYHRAIQGLKVALSHLHPYAKGSTQ